MKIVVKKCRNIYTSHSNSDIDIEIISWIHWHALDMNQDAATNCYQNKFKIENIKRSKAVKSRCWLISSKIKTTWSLDNGFISHQMWLNVCIIAFVRCSRCSAILKKKQQLSTFLLLACSLILWWQFMWMQSCICLYATLWPITFEAKSLRSHEQTLRRHRRLRLQCVRACGF